MTTGLVFVVAFFILVFIPRLLYENAKQLSTGIYRISVKLLKKISYKIFALVGGAILLYIEYKIKKKRSKKGDAG